MVDVLHVVIQSGGQSSTVPELSDHPGKMLVMVAFGRGGAESSEFSSDNASIENAMSQADGLASFPGDVNIRRSVWVWSGILPDPVGSSRIIDMQLFDGSQNSVDCSWIAMILDMDDTWAVAGTATDDSGIAATNSQDTGTAFSPDAGPTYSVAAITCRGDTTVDWEYSTSAPDNPGGGTWDLNVVTGEGNADNRRRGSIGVFDWGSQPSQTYEETATLGTDRVSTAIYVVFVQASAGPGLGTVVEVDEARPLVASKSSTLSPAVTGSTALSLVGSKAGDLSPVVEGSELLALSGVKTASLTPIIEGSSVRPLLDAESSTLGRVDVGNVARPLTGLKRAALGVVVDGSEALPLGSAKARPLSPILVGSRAMPFVTDEDAVLGRIVEQTGLLSLSGTKFQQLGTVIDGTQLLVLSGTEIEQLGTVISTLEVLPIVAIKRKQMATVIEVDVLVAITPSGGHGPPYRKRRTLNAIDGGKTLRVLED